MNAREAMQALLDGKIVRDCKNNLHKIDEESGMILTKSGNKDWVFGFTIWNGGFELAEEYPLTFELAEEYPLTFEQAIKAMVDGKVVANNTNAGLFRFKEGFEYSTFGNCWNSCVMGTPRHEEYKWKVIE